MKIWGKPIQAQGTSSKGAGWESWIFQQPAGGCLAGEWPQERSVRLVGRGWGRLWRTWKATAVSSGKPSEGFRQEWTQFQFTYRQDDFVGCGRKVCRGECGSREAASDEAR